MKKLIYLDGNKMIRSHVDTNIVVALFVLVAKVGWILVANSVKAISRLLFMTYGERKILDKLEDTEKKHK